MMAAYQPQPGGMHPGMPTHGHPGMAPTPGPHMGQPMMHPGVSGPGQPHVGQAAVMGMQQNGHMGVMPGGHHPGAAGALGMPGQPGQPGQGMGGQSMAGGAPNAHALSHLTPQQMMQQQHMQQQMQANPHQVMAMHQHMMRQRHMQMQAQAQANGQMNMQQGGMQGMTQQQLMQLQQQNNLGVNAGPGGVQLTPNLQSLLRMQQQHQAQAQQQHQQAQVAQHLAMQHVNSQQSNQGQPGAPNQQGPPGPPQMRPQSRMANPNEHNQGPPAPGQQQGLQAQQGAPQQGQQPNQQQGQPQQGMNQMQQQHALQQRQNMMALRSQQQQQYQAQRFQAAQAQAQAQQQQNSGAFMLRIMLFADDLSNFNIGNGKDVAHWHNFVDKHFAHDGRLLHKFDDGTPKPKVYEVLRPTIPQYFSSYFESGAQSLRLHTEHARETPLPNGRYQVTCQNVTLTVSYPSGARLEMNGRLSALFAPGSDIIECLEIQQTSTEEILSRTEIEKVLSNFSPPITNKSPKMAKNKLPKAQQKLQQQLDGLTIDHFPKAPKGTMGVASRVQQFLEIGETMNVMAELMHFSHEKKMRPEQALEAWVTQYDAQGANDFQQHGQPGTPQINLPPNGVPTGNRTPSMQHMQMPNQAVPNTFSSPSVSNLNLPMQPNGINGSPHIPNHPGLAPNMSMQPNSHTPSPRVAHMAAPPMVPQHSQQGTNSSAASATTSPNVHNKRRRSTVKLEEEGGGPGGGADGVQGGNQPRVKPSPRVPKKPKPGG